MKRVKRPGSIISRKDLVRELEEQIAFSGYSPATRNHFLQIFKAALYRGVAEIRHRFEVERIDGAEVVLADSYLVDGLVLTVYEFASTHVFAEYRSKQLPEMAIAAIGGYGRAELSPFSDIDLMFLLPDKSSPVHAQIVEFVLYTLWDIGLKVGHATRTVDECIKLARKDLTIRTSLLEARWLCGSRKLYQEFERRFLAEVVAGTGAAYVEAKLAERDARHSRMGDSRYVLEPHIKEGKGGLRDLQTLFWIAKYLYRVKNMEDLVQRSVFTAADARHFRQALNFLWTVRCHLHYVTGRPEERLTFDNQTVIAERLGYRSHNGDRSVERFMKHYFLVTKAVGDLTRVLCAVLEDEHKKLSARLRLPSLALSRRLPEGLKIEGGRLTVTSSRALANDPRRMLRLFWEAQRLGLDVHPKALRLVGQNLRLIDASVRADPGANRLFMEMLTAERDPETTLRRLSEAGVFARFVPEFARVIGQMQYDMYHIHTVEEHSIRAIGILHRIEHGELRAQHPAASEVIHEISSRRALYLAVLLHDIGKGRKGDHSEIGARIALDLAPRLGLNEWEADTVSWLVRHHLLMAHTAFKRDADNPKTVSDFVAVVRSPERLRMLLVLTDADVHAVGPGIWNAWKAGLLSELYYRALEEMEIAAGQPRERRSARVEHAKQALRERLSDWPCEELEEYIARGYADYWLAFDVAAQAHHFQLMRDANKRNPPLSIETRPDPLRAVTEVNVYAPDHAGLFARIAGAIALSGATIVEAKIVTLANSMALDMFRIQDPQGGAFDETRQLDRLRNRIESAISGKLYPARELETVRLRGLPTRTVVFKVPPMVLIENKASVGHTVIEVNGRDRLGFLHDVTSTLTELGLQISSAHITTYGETVVDVFYVKDVFGLKVEDPSKLRRIKDQLLRAIAPVQGQDQLPTAPVVDVAD